MMATYNQVADNDAQQPPTQNIAPVMLVVRHPWQTSEEGQDKHAHLKCWT